MPPATAFAPATGNASTPTNAACGTLRCTDGTHRGGTGTCGAAGVCNVATARALHQPPDLHGGRRLRLPDRLGFQGVPGHRRVHPQHRLLHQRGMRVDGARGAGGLQRNLPDQQHLLVSDHIVRLLACSGISVDRPRHLLVRRLHFPQSPHVQRQLHLLGFDLQDQLRVGRGLRGRLRLLGGVLHRQVHQRHRLREQPVLRAVHRTVRAEESQRRGVHERQ